MTAFGNIFRSPTLEGIEESGENGQRASVVGLDLDSGVVRIQPAHPVPSDPHGEDDSES